MTLNSSGPISLAGTTAGQSIEKENGGNGTTQISLNDGAVRTLAGVTTPNSTITMPTNFYGKSNRVVVTVTLASSTAYYTWNKCKVPGYVAGKTCATLKINSGVYVYSGSTGSQAMTISNTWTSGDVVKVINCGYILGMGGTGGNGDTCGGNNYSGGGGGTALVIQYPVSITNNNTIGGGGGGGGGTDIHLPDFGCGPDYINLGGGGGGGGRTGLTPSPGGYNGGPGYSGGAGGGGGGGTYFYGNAGPGGSGGGWGSGGGCGSGGGRAGGAGGGGGGNATVGNSYVTWITTGNRYGPLG